MDSGHHLVYQMLYLLGMPVALQAFCSRQVLVNMEGEDTAQVNVKFADGSVGLILQSWASAMDQGISGIRILGEKGNIIITDALYHNGERISGDVEYGDSFKGQAHAFVDAVRRGTPRFPRWMMSKTRSASSTPPTRMRVSHPFCLIRPGKSPKVCSRRRVALRRE